MMIETNISGLKIGLYPIEKRASAVKDFFTSTYSPDNPNQNISHTANILAFGEHQHDFIGIDIEVGPAPIDFMRVATTFFWPSEITFLNTVDANQQANTFLALWTAKEAHCKMLRSNIHDGLPGPDFTTWLIAGCPTNYQYNHDQKETILFFKKGVMDIKQFFLSVCLSC